VKALIARFIFINWKNKSSIISVAIDDRFLDISCRSELLTTIFVRIVIIKTANMNDLSNKVAYITGGSKGIGYGIAKTLYGLGMKVAITSRTLEAAQKAASGDVVLLSPGCSSFDMFQNYQHRGEVFRQAVQHLDRDQNRRVRA